MMAPLRVVLERHLDAWEAAGRVQLAEAVRWEGQGARRAGA